MGAWYLEIMRMGFYVTFPVGVYYYCNRPAFYEEYVVKHNEKFYPPENKEHTKLFEDLKKNMRNQVQYEE